MRACVRACVCVCVCFQVRVDKWNNISGIFTGGFMTVGVVTQSPDDITLPDDAEELTAAVFVRIDGVKDWGTTEVQYSVTVGHTGTVLSHCGTHRYSTQSL